MALQYSVPVRNARLDVVESAIGASPVLELRSGPPPASCAAAASGTLLAQGALPADWMGAAAAGAKDKSGAWQVVASSPGAIGHFRIYDSTGAVCHAQGTVSAAGGGGDAIADSTGVVASQVVSITGFTLTAGNA